MFWHIMTGPSTLLMNKSAISAVSRDFIDSGNEDYGQGRPLVFNLARKLRAGMPWH